MKFKKVILSLSLFTTLGFANDDISYDYIGINYGYSGTSRHNDDTYGIDAAFSFNDNWYLSADVSRLLVDLETVRENNQFTRSNNLFTRNNYALSLGFHKSISSKTDFFAELGYEYSRVSVPVFFNTADITEIRNFKNSSNDIIGRIGLRTAFNEKFEMTIALNTGSKQYPSYHTWSPSILNEFGYDLSGYSELNYNKTEVEVFGLYKFNEKNSLRAGYDSVDGLKLGWRYNW